MFESDETEPQQSVFCTLNERHGDPTSDLTCVVHTEPLVREMTAAVHHELWSEHAPERPPSDQRRHQCVTEARERRLGPPPSLEVEADGQRERDTAEARESALPDRDPLRGMARVVAPIGRDIGQSCAEQTSHDQEEREAPEWLERDLVALKTSSGVVVGHVGGEGESEAVQVKDEGTEVDRSGDAGHLGPRATETDESVAETYRHDVYARAGHLGLNHLAGADVHRDVLIAVVSVEEKVTGLNVS